MQKTIIRRNENISLENLSQENLPTLLQRVYAIRGIQSQQELERNLENLIPYQQLLNIDASAVLLADHLQMQKKFLIVGDFDADGATSTALAYRALKMFGAKHVDFLVPNRFTFGYGLTTEIVEVAKKEFSPDIIITVDNGIANNAGVARARELQIQVLITDHHLAPTTLPDANVIVNPNQPGDSFPSKNLAGVGVIFYVMLALRRQLVAINWFQKNNLPEPNMATLLDLVALGTVADVVPLDQNNRVLVHQGLRRIRAGKCIPGIIALLEAAGRSPHKIVANDLGFAVGPRLNAAGRLDDMSLGIQCLLADDMHHAREMATVLNELNDERKSIEHDMQEQAMLFLSKLQSQQKEKLPTGICLFDESWHQGVIGILASRIKEKYHRPVIAFAPSIDNDEIKGSARSIPGLHIRDALAQLDSMHPNLIIKFGGHAMAAGLSLKKDSFSDFAKLFNEIVCGIVTQEQLNNCVYSDGELLHSDLTLQNAEMLREAGPWGQGFPEPLFDGIFEIIEQRLVGNKHLKLILQTNNQLIDAIAFNVDINSWPNYRCDKVFVAYRMDINEFRGKRSIQLIIEYIQAV